MTSIPFACSCQCASMRDHARKLVADAPPLTREQLDALAVLLSPAIRAINAKRRAQSSSNRRRPATRVAA